MCIAAYTGTHTDLHGHHPVGAVGCEGGEATHAGESVWLCLRPGLAVAWRGGPQSCYGRSARVNDFELDADRLWKTYTYAL